MCELDLLKVAELNVAIILLLQCNCKYFVNYKAVEWKLWRNRFKKV